KAQESLAPRGVAEVQRDRFLVAVAAEKARSHGVAPSRADRPEHIARWGLDLQHFGAEVTQHLGCIGSEHDGRQIENSQTAQEIEHPNILFTSFFQRLASASPSEK